jgi:hypothetical protein
MSAVKRHAVRERDLAERMRTENSADIHLDVSRCRTLIGQILDGSREALATARYATDIPFASAVVLQHHTTEVRFRDVRIRSLSSGVR